MSTAIRSSTMFAALALGLFALGITAAQAHVFLGGANAPFVNWLRNHSPAPTSQAPTVANDVPTVVYPLPSRATAGDVEERLLDLGFTAVTSVSHSGNIYTADATWDGQRVDLRIDGKNGRISARPS